MSGNHLFSQLLKYINWDEFDATVTEYKGDFSAKTLKCKDILKTMIFAQFSGSDSLREIIQGLESSNGKLSHLGMESVPSRSNLSYANSTRPWEIFQKTYESLLVKASQLCTQSGPKRRFKSKLYSIDSTVIDLCQSIFDWAKFRKAKGAIKVHTVLDHDGLLPCFVTVTEGKVHDVKAFKEQILNEFEFPKGSVIVFDRAYLDFMALGNICAKGSHFVTRLKSNTLYEVIEDLEIKEINQGIIRKDSKIKLTGEKAGLCPKILRRVVVWDEINQREIDLITDQMTWSPATIADIYKQRWQIELFFKQIKQNLKIKSFVGTSANAVKIQVYSALCSILLMKILKSVSDSRRALDKKKSFSFSNFIALLRINLFIYRDLTEWLTNPFAKPPEFRVENYQEEILFGQQSSA
jgi:hypothetical protein